MKKIVLTAQRRRETEAKCTAEEASALRGRYGSLSWLQRQTRPDLSYASSKGQTAMSGPKVEDIPTEGDNIIALTVFVRGFNQEPHNKDWKLLTG